MIDRAEYERKLDEAKGQAYLVDRLEGLAELKKDASDKLSSYEYKRGRSNEGPAAKVGFGFFGVTESFNLAANYFLAPSADVVFISLLFGSMALALASLVAAEVYKNTDKAKAKGLAKFDRKFGDDMETLKQVKAKTSEAINENVAFYRALPSAQKAGVVKLEDLVEQYPEIRRATVQAFAADAGAVPEQPGLMTLHVDEVVVPPRSTGRPSNGPTAG